jgi:serine phosphatase RsbU (regulator of sigma subunit)
MKFGLRSKIVLVLVLVGVLALVLVALFAARAIDRLRADLGVAYARDATLLKQARITAPLIRDLALSLRMADSDPIREWLLDEDNADKRARALREVEGYRTQFASRSTFVISALSRNYYFNSPREAVSDQPRYTLDPEHRPSDSWFPSVIGMPGAYDTNVSYDTELHVASVWMNVLMRAGEQRLGLVGTGLELNQFLQAFTEDTQEGVTPIIINSDAAILAHPDRTRIANQSATQQAPPQHRLWSLIDPGPSTELASQALEYARQAPGSARPVQLQAEGREVLFAASYIPDLKWYVLSMVDLGTARLLDARQLWLFGLSAFALFMVAALLLAYLVNRLVVAPLFALKHSAQAIAAGNYAVALPASSRDEIGELSQAFASMTEQIRAHTEHLESTVRVRTAELVEANAVMAAANTRIADSISYASRIQQAMLPQQALGEELGAQHYLLWRPRDVVGGDFYLFQRHAHGFLLGVADCAGHGVPGAMMTMLGNAALDRAIAESGAADPAAILRATDHALRSMLHVDQRAKGTATSMELGLVHVDLLQRQLCFAGARIDLLIAHPDGPQRLIGGRRALADRQTGEYQNQIIALDPRATYLMSSDGLLDQNGEQVGLSFGRARLHDVLQAQCSAELAEFGMALQQTLAQFQGDAEQRDDICVLAFRVPL